MKYLPTSTTQTAKISAQNHLTTAWLGIKQKREAKNTYVWTGGRVLSKYI